MQQFFRLSVLCALLVLQTVAWAEESAGLKLYRQLGLPFPPKSAKLVLITSKGKEPRKCLAWQIREGEFMVASTIEKTKDMPAVSVRAITEDQALKEELTSAGNVYFYCRFEAEFSVPMAMQLEARGMARLAQKQLGVQDWDARGNQSVTGRIYLFAYKDALADLLKPNPNRKAIVGRLKQLSEQLEGRWSSHLGQVEALKPSTAEPGTVDALIDEWIEVQGDAKWYRPEWETGKFDKVLSLGLSAVPTLIRHLDDRRSTLIYRSRLNNWGPGFLSVGDLCRHILAPLMGSYVGYGGDLATEESPEDWWRRSKGVKETDFLMKAVFPEEKGGGVWPEAVPLRMICLKHAGLLPDVYKLSLARGKTEPQPFTDAIAQSSISLDEKLQLLALGVGSEHAMHRDRALHAIWQLSPKNMGPALIIALGKPEPFEKDVSAYWVGRYVAASGDQEAFDAMAEAMRKGSAVQKVDAMRGLKAGIDSQTPRSLRNQCLRLFAQFFQDSALCEERFGDFPVIEVGHAAHRCADLIIHNQIRMTGTWDDAQWRRYAYMVEMKIKLWNLGIWPPEK